MIAARWRASSVGQAAAAAVAIGLCVGATDARAQAAASGCGDIQAQLLERKSIADRLSAAGKKQMDAKVACQGFNQLVQNGTKLVSWVETNKDWCQIPDTFLQGIKADHAKAQDIRGKACGVAAKQTEMERQAKSGGGPNGAGTLLGGNGLSGASALPQGAL